MSDSYPAEPHGCELRWRCSLHGCMWWLWSAVDDVRALAGWQHVMVRRYVAPPAALEANRWTLLPPVGAHTQEGLFV